MMGWFSGCCGFSGLGGFGSFGWIGLIFNLAIIVIVISLIVWVVRRFTAGGSAFTSLQASGGAQSSPRETRGKSWIFAMHAERSTEISTNRWFQI